MKQKVIIVKAQKKDHYHININGRYLGMWERSELRSLINTVDAVVN